MSKRINEEDVFVISRARMLAGLRSNLTTRVRAALKAHNAAVERLLAQDHPDIETCRRWARAHGAVACAVLDYRLRDLPNPVRRRLKKARAS